MIALLGMSLGTMLVLLGQEDMWGIALTLTKVLTLQQVQCVMPILSLIIRHFVTVRTRAIPVRGIDDGSSGRVPGETFLK